MALYRKKTPLESYLVKGVKVYVKRDDLFGIYPAPQLGKLRGLKVLIENLYKDGVRLVGCWDTRVSYLGQGVAAACKDFSDMGAIISYPKLKNGIEPNAIAVSRNLGAEILPIRGNHVGICYAQVRKHVEKRKGYMLPFGLECQESVDAISLEASKIPGEMYSYGTIVTTCGSGVTLSGIINGLKFKPKKIIGISSGRSINKIEACLKKYCPQVPNNVKIYKAVLEYYEIPQIEGPFPMHPNYDLKAWQYLLRNIKRLPQPILFWNIGA